MLAIGTEEGPKNSLPSSTNGTESASSDNTESSYFDVEMTSFATEMANSDTEMVNSDMAATQPGSPMAIAADKSKFETAPFEENPAQPGQLSND